MGKNGSTFSASAEDIALARQSTLELIWLNVGKLLMEEFHDTHISRRRN